MSRRLCGWNWRHQPKYISYLCNIFNVYLRLKYRFFKKIYLTRMKEDGWIEGNNCNYQYGKGKKYPKKVKTSACNPIRLCKDVEWKRWKINLKAISSLNKSNMCCVHPFVLYLPKPSDLWFVTVFIHIIRLGPLSIRNSVAREDSRKRWPKMREKETASIQRAPTKIRDSQITRAKLLLLNLMIIRPKIYDIFDTNHLCIMIDVWCWTVFLCFYQIVLVVSVRL